MALAPIIGVQDGETNADFAGDDYYVTYNSGKLPDGTPGVNEGSNSNGYNDLRLPAPLTVKYDGVPVAEYNPQFWNGSIDGHATISNGSDANWYSIVSYVTNNTVVFAGWQLNGEGPVIDPGADLSKISWSDGNRATLVAKWALLENYSDTLSVKSEGKDVPAVTGWKGSKYTNIIKIAGDMNYLDILYGCKVPLTIRGDGANSVLKYTEDNIQTTETWAPDNLPRWKGDIYVASAAMIIDQLRVEGTDGGSGIKVTIGALYAAGNQLIIGTGVTSDKFSVAGGSFKIDGIVGNAAGTVNESSKRGDQVQYQSTDVRIFSGTYKHVVGGSIERSMPDTDTSLTIIGGTVRGGIYGGNAIVNVKDDCEVRNTKVLIVGGSCVDDYGNRSKYEFPTDTTTYVSVVGGSRYGKVTSTDVQISGEAEVFMVQGGNRDASSVNSTTETAGVTISGNAEILFLVAGAVTDGNMRKDHYPVGSTNVVIGGSATIGKPGVNPDENGYYPGVVFGGGWDTGNESIARVNGSVDGEIIKDESKKMIPNSSCKNTQLQVVDNATIHGSVFGGGYRGCVGERNAENVGTVVRIDISGGTIHGNVYGGGRGGPDLISGKDDKKGETGTSYVFGDVNVTVSGGTIEGSLYGGGQGVPAKNSELNFDDVGRVEGNIIIQVDAKQNAHPVVIGGDVYGGGCGAVNLSGSGYKASDNIAKVYGSTTVTVSGSVSVSGSIYGGGRWGIVNGGTDVDISEGTIGGSVFGGGRGWIVNPDSTRGKVVGSTSVCLFSGIVGSGAKGGSVFGGGESGYVGGSTTVKIGESGLEPPTVNGSVYGGGKGDPNKDIIIGSVAGSSSVTIDHGAKVTNRVFGGGEFGLLGTQSTPGTVSIVLGNAEIGGDVYCGGLGASGKTSTYVSERTIRIDGASIGGSVYGGSRDGDDNCLYDNGEFTETIPGNATIDIIRGNIASGISGNVYGGGYAGHAHYNVDINVGTPALGVGDTPSGALKIGSIFGGANVGIRTESQTVAPKLMMGTTDVHIGGSTSYSDFTITGDIFGGGDFCDVEKPKGMEGGHRKVLIENFNQGETKMLSIQKADDLTVKNSKIKLAGNVDGSSTDGSNRMSLNLIEMLNIVSDKGGSIIEMDYAARSISGYSSEYLSVTPSSPNDYNKLKINNGKTFFILGDNDNDGGVSTISGKTLFESDANDYYGAFIVGSLDAALNGDAEFWIIKDGRPEKANTSDYARLSGSNDSRAWYLSGAFSVEKTVVFDNAGKSAIDTPLSNSLNFILPNVVMDSQVRYTGHHLELNSPGSLAIVANVNQGDPGVGLQLDFGMTEPSGRNLTFNSGSGVTLSDNLGSVISDSSSTGIGLNMKVWMKPGFRDTGFAGSVILHFAEIKDGIALGIFDVKVSVYLRISQAAQEMDADVVMRPDKGGKYSGSVELYLPALNNGAIGSYLIKSYYKTDSTPFNGTLTIASVFNNLGKDGWIDANYRNGLVLSDNHPIDLGTGAVYAPVLEVRYQTSDRLGLDNRFPDVGMVVEVKNSNGDMVQRLTITLRPELVTTQKVTFNDKVLSGSGTWGEFVPIFSIDVEFGRTIHDYCLIYSPSELDNSSTGSYLASIGGCLYTEDSKVWASTSITEAKNKADQMNGNVGAKDYTASSVEDFLQILLENKPKSSYHIGDDSKTIDFVYKANNPTWNNGMLGLSRFNFQRPITQDQPVYSAYGVEITIKAYVNESPRFGVVTPPVIVPVPDSESGLVKIKPDALKVYISSVPGYTIDENGWWYGSDYEHKVPLSSELTIYSSLTVFVDLKLIEYTLSIEIKNEENQSSGGSVSSVEGISSEDPYKFTVESNPRINVNPDEGYQVVGATGSSEGSRVSFNGNVVSFKPPADDLTITIIMGLRFLVTIDMPSDGHSDNALFGFNDTGAVVPGIDGDSHKFPVKGNETLDIKVPETYSYMGESRTVTYSLYDTEYNLVEGWSYTKSDSGKVPIGTITSDATYHLYVTVEWRVEVQPEAGFSYTVEHLSDPRGSAHPSDESGYVHAGDKVIIKPDDGHFFDSLFWCTGAEWDGTSNPRIYVVSGGQDVKFGKASQCSVTLVFEFKDEGSVVAGFRVYGIAKVTKGGVTENMGGGTTDGNGRLSFPLNGAVPGDQYAIAPGFAGFDHEGETVTIGNPVEEVVVTLSTVPMDLVFEDPKESQEMTYEWMVTSTETVGLIFGNPEKYYTWYTGTGFLDNDKCPTVEMFNDSDGFYDGTESLTLKAVPFLVDLTGTKGLPVLMVLLLDTEINGSHQVSAVPGCSSDSGSISVGGSQVTFGYTSDGTQSTLTVSGCPEGTGALKIFGEHVVVVIVSVSDIEDIS